MRNHLHRLGALAGTTIASVAAAQITSNGTPTFSYAVDGGVVQSVDMSSSLASDGRMRYTATVLAADDLELTIDYMVDSTNDPIASIEGSLSVINLTGMAHGIDTSVEFPACPTFHGGTLFGGSVTYFAVTDANGGGVTCLPGATHTWDALLDGNSAWGVHYCPYQMVTTGSGTMLNVAPFGGGAPSIAGPASTSSVGSRNRVTVSAGDALTVTSVVLVESLGAGQCFGDLTGDGFIDGHDITEILGSWGPNGFCQPADLTQDGVIDGLDLAQILGAWGPCGN